MSAQFDRDSEGDVTQLQEIPWEQVFPGENDVVEVPFDALLISDNAAAASTVNQSKDIKDKAESAKTKDIEAIDTAPIDFSNWTLPNWSSPMFQTDMYLCSFEPLSHQASVFKIIVHYLSVNDIIRFSRSRDFYSVQSTDRELQVRLYTGICINEKNGFGLSRAQLKHLSAEHYQNQLYGWDYCGWYRRPASNTAASAVPSQWVSTISSIGAPDKAIVSNPKLELDPDSILESVFDRSKTAPEYTVVPSVLQSLHDTRTEALGVGEYTSFEDARAKGDRDATAMDESSRNRLLRKFRYGSDGQRAITELGYHPNQVRNPNFGSINSIHYDILARAENWEELVSTIHTIEKDYKYYSKEIPKHNAAIQELCVELSALKQAREELENSYWKERRNTSTTVTWEDVDKMWDDPSLLAKDTVTKPIAIVQGLDQMSSASEEPAKAKENDAQSNKESDENMTLLALSRKLKEFDDPIQDMEKQLKKKEEELESLKAKLIGEKNKHDEYRQRLVNFHWLPGYPATKGLILGHKNIQGLNNFQAWLLQHGIAEFSVRYKHYNQSETLINLIVKLHKQQVDYVTLQKTFEEYIQYSETQLNGLDLNFTRADIQAAWFSQAHVLAVNADMNLEAVRGVSENALLKEMIAIIGYVDRETLSAYQGYLSLRHIVAMKKGFHWEEIKDLNPIEFDLVLECDVDHRRIRGLKHEDRVKLSRLHVFAMQEGILFEDLCHLTEDQLKKQYSEKLKFKDELSRTFRDNRKAWHVKSVPFLNGTETVLPTDDQLVYTLLSPALKNKAQTSNTTSFLGFSAAGQTAASASAARPTTAVATATTAAAAAITATVTAVAVSSVSNPLPLPSLL